MLPLDDRTRSSKPPLNGPPRKRPASVYLLSGHRAVPESVAVNVRGRSYKIIADVEIEKADCSGVIFAHGSRFGGHSLFIKDKKLYYVYNFLGIKQQKFEGFVSGSRTRTRRVHLRREVHEDGSGQARRRAAGPWLWRVAGQHSSPWTTRSSMSQQMIIL